MNNDYIIIKTKYGDCRVRRDHYKDGVTPTIQTAINKNEYFAKQSMEVYGNIFDYSLVEYVNAATPVKIICKEHGIFIVTPNAHFSSIKMAHCSVCKKNEGKQKILNKVDLFIEKALLKHKDKFDYSEINYTGSHGKIKVRCKEHNHTFEQIAREHIKGDGGCEFCRRKSISKARKKNPTGWSLSRWILFAQKSKQFDSFKVYILECYDENEKFIKIGRTYQSINSRFRTKGMLPYKYNIVREFTGNPEDMFELEWNLKSKYSKQKYVPMKNFNGMHECFDINLTIE